MKILVGLVGVLISSLIFLTEKSNGQLLKAVDFESNSILHAEDNSIKIEGIRNDPSLEWRLSPNIKPSRYELELFPIIDEDVEGLGEQWTVPGTVKIHLAAHDTATNKIVLHVKDIDLIENASTLTKLEDNSTVQILDMHYNDTMMMLTIDLNEDLEVGTVYVLSFVFVSQIQEEFHGMYRTSYFDPKTDETRWIAITQMEALHARELFPCFDEPGYKAIFSTKIGRKDAHVALTNGQSVSNTTIPNIDGWTLETFSETVPMSTYLLAFVISDFGYSEANATINPDIVVRTYAPNHYIERQAGVYAAEKAALLLKEYGNIFGQKYPLPKMDSAAVTDFMFGAMENYGLNIYRENALLYFPDEGLETERESITRIIAHELAHQHFGNLVSPAWWTHIWLNEGMATFVQYIGMQAVAAEFNSWDNFITQVLQRALTVDANPDATHPLKIGEEVWFDKNAMSWFDTISYEKGGSIARMMEGFLTPSVFLEGLKTYQELKHHQSAVQDDLFDALNQHAGDKIPSNLNISDIMQGWTLQSGFPVLFVAAEGSQTTISQSQYNQPNSMEKWIIPISIASQSSPDFGAEPEHWLIDEEMITIDESPDNWIIINAGSTGYYRVLYDAPLEKNILDQLQEDDIHAHAKSQLIDDYFTFAFDSWKSVDIKRALEFTKYMSSKEETEIVVWTPLFRHLEFYLNIFGSAGSLDNMKAYLVPRIKSAIEASGGYDRITIDSRGQDVLSHTKLLDWSCALYDQDCLDYSSNLVDEWRMDMNNNKIAHNLRPVVYCAAARRDNSLHNFLLNAYITQTSSRQRQFLLQSFQCFEDGETINNMLEETLANTLFRDKSDAAYFLSSLASNYKMRTRLVTFVSNKTSEILEWFNESGSGEAVLTSVISSLSNFMSTSEELEQIETFIEENKDLFQDKLDVYVNKIQANIAKNQEFGIPMQQFFQDNSDPIPTDPTETTTTPTETTTMPTTTPTETTTMPTETTTMPTTTPTETTTMPTTAPTETTTMPTTTPTETTTMPTTAPTETTTTPTQPTTTTPTEITTTPTETTPTITTPIVTITSTTTETITSTITSTPTTPTSTNPTTTVTTSTESDDSGSSTFHNVSFLTFSFVLVSRFMFI